MFDPHSKAAIVLNARYLRKDESGKVIETPEQMLMRVANAVAAAEELYGAPKAEVDKLARDFFAMMAGGYFLPNSPTLMNAGRGTGSLSACFVLGIDDSIDSIFQAQHWAAKVQQWGGGTGLNFSSIRPAGDRVVSSGGTASGPVSFMGCFNAVTEAVTQGAHRRGANMGILDVGHPDIVRFINAKQNLNVLNNFNISVGLTDDFMHKLRTAPHDVHVVRNPRSGASGTVLKTPDTPYTCKDVFDLIARRAWESGEPGVAFLDTINAANPTPHLGPIRALNPCGEQPLLEYESCNLGSINLLKFVHMDDVDTFDFKGLIAVIHLAVRFLDNVIDINNYPLPEIQKRTLGNRKIGLGLKGFADTLSAQCIPYDSDAGLAFGEKVMKMVNEESHKASAVMAETRGVFPNWKGSVWEQRGIPMRHACTTTIAPTGTISILAGCSSGIEPHFSVALGHKILDGQRFFDVNPVFERLALDAGIFSVALVHRIAERGSLQELTQIPEHIRRAFVTAHDIAPEAHLRMQAVFQKHCDAAIAKTINLRGSATVQDVKKAILLAHELGCKGVTVYRDGCRPNQPLESTPAVRVKASSSDRVVPMELPDVMSAIRVKQRTPFGTMHVKIVVDPSTGLDREVFAQLGKGGDVAVADLEGMCRLASLYLRVNGSLGDIVKQLDGIGSSLSIPTKDGRIASLADGLAKAIQKYVQAKAVSGIDMLLLGKTDLSALSPTPQPAGGDGASRSANVYRVKCACGNDLVFEEGCEKCLACGWSRC